MVGGLQGLSVIHILRVWTSQLVLVVKNLPANAGDVREKLRHLPLGLPKQNTGCPAKFEFQINNTF